MSTLELNRRQALIAGGLGALSLGMPGTVMGSDKLDASGQAVPAEKSCIFVLLCGGPSHIDTWDMKPDAPPSIRGPYAPIATQVPGMRINEMHTELAKLTDQFTLINSMTHPGAISNHFDAMHNLLSGQSEKRVAQGVSDDQPYIGSFVAKARPSKRNIVSNAWLIKCVGPPVFCAPNIGIGGYIGSAYAPVFVGSEKNHPAMDGFKPPEIYDPVDENRLGRRRELLAGLESDVLAKDARGSGSITGTQNGSLDVSSGNVTIASGGATTGTVALSGGQLIVASGGQLGNTQGVNVSGGTLNVQTGGQIVGNGQINVAGTLNANGEVQGLVTVNSGGVLKGNGTVDAVVLQSGGTLAVGNSVGALTIDGGPGGGPALTLNAGSIIEFEFNNVSGGPGVGWDYLELGGGLLTINATNVGFSNQVEVHVNSLALNDSTHGANNFNAAAGVAGSIQEYYWKFIGLNNLNTQISYTGPSSLSGLFHVVDDLTGAGVFDLADGNPYDRPISSIGQGTFKVLAGDFGQGTGLYIYYSAVPEPGSMLLAGLGSIAAGWYGRRKLRRKQNGEAATSSPDESLAACEAIRL